MFVCESGLNLISRLLPFHRPRTSAPPLPNASLSAMTIYTSVISRCSGSSLSRKLRVGLEAQQPRFSQITNCLSKQRQLFDETTTRLKTPFPRVCLQMDLKLLLIATLLGALSCGDAQKGKIGFHPALMIPLCCCQRGW